MVSALSMNIDEADDVGGVASTGRTAVWMPGVAAADGVMGSSAATSFSASFFALAAASNRSTSFLYLNPAAKYARRPPSILSTTSCALRSELSRSTSAPATASSRER